MEPDSTQVARRELPSARTLDGFTRRLPWREEALDPLMEGLDHPRMPVAGEGDGEACRHVHEAVAVDIDQLAPTASPHEGRVGGAEHAGDVRVGR